MSFLLNVTQFGNIPTVAMNQELLEDDIQKAANIFLEGAASNGFDHDYVFPYTYNFDTFLSYYGYDDEQIASIPSWMKIECLERAYYGRNY